MGRILCLHGFVQNGPLFARKSSGVRKALEKEGFELVYPTGPVQLDISDLPFDVDKSAGTFEGSAHEEMRSWWPNSESRSDHLDVSQALKSVQECLKQNGPVDGVLGFSQGAGLAGILANTIESLAPNQPRLKFVILYAGFRLGLDKNQAYYREVIRVPSLHIVGSLDTVMSRERQDELWQACDESTRTRLEHAGGHYVPNSKAEVTKLVAWVRSVVGTQAADTPAPQSSSGTCWDEFDKIGRS